MQLGQAQWFFEVSAGTAMPDRTPPPWAVESVRIVDPDPGWPEGAERFAAEITPLLGQWLSSDVLHVGSTAVPGLPVPRRPDTRREDATHWARGRDTPGVEVWLGIACVAVGRLVVIEGLDGAGKRTLADTLTAALTAQHASVARMAFPRYGTDIHAELVRDALYGRLGDVAESVHGMAVLFALDRRDATEQLQALQRSHDVVLLDRYVASNAAYGAARLHEAADGPFVEWIRALEVDRFGVPVPQAQLLLRVPCSVASARADRRALTDSARCKDSYETDHELQTRCAAVYDGLAANGWLAPWSVLDGVATSQPSDLAMRILGQ